jgi:hypothetical protein
MWIGAPAETKMSEAFFSAINWNKLVEDHAHDFLLCGGLSDQPRSSSLMLVLARVCASTCLTMTAQ